MVVVVGWECDAPRVRVQWWPNREATAADIDSESVLVGSVAAGLSAAWRQSPGPGGRGRFRIV